ncbi:acylaminoacyl-peptidase [Salinibacter sp. 10B]|uniref:prolyl oligopeptidase family serine peptidase n=1 Tax=Salinibacter sp. 10B TaxID=1923971 RepID=UPI000CF4D00E|nr:prolyl oligopeptidase family serine peptidase [Salinibacter sp. 10B]PQJ34712.1 acylaminoacyl-peptidase [Salinibacter sp. 10B]
MISSSVRSFKRWPIAAGLCVGLLLSVGLLRSNVAVGQAAPAGATLDETDYGKWERLGGATLSPEGDWMATPIRRVNDKNVLRIHHTEQDSTIAVDFGRDPSFSADGRWLAYSIGMSEEKREKLRKQEKPVRRTLGLLNLQTGDTTLVPSVADFAFSDDGRWLAMMRYPPQEAPDGMEGADLLLRDLQSGTYTSFGNVSDFAWQDEGPRLAMTIDGAEQAGNGIRLYNAASGRLRTLASEPGDYTGLSWQPSGTGLAAMRARSSDDWEHKTHVVLAWRNLAGGPVETHRFDPAEVDVFPDSLRIVEYRTPEWATDGDRLFFGVQKREAAEENDDENGPAADSAAADSSLEEYDPADVQVWHTSDVEIIPWQEVRAEHDRQDNFLTAWHLDAGEASVWTRLGTERTEDVEVLHGGDRAVGLDETPYRQERMFGPVYHDLYVIDVTTGERKRVAQKVQYWEGPSPNGRYLLWLKDDQYHTYDVQQGETATVTADVPVPVVDTADDHTVEQKPPFGVAGWTEGDRSVVVYSEYDAWRLAPDGAESERLTKGRADSVEHRYVDLTEEDPGEPDVIPRNEPLYWSLYDEWTEEHGYARSTQLTATPERAVWKPKMVTGLTRADSADVYAYRVEDFEDSPDYFRAGPALADAEPVTDTNPFQEEYAWGRSELVTYETADGKTLQGALFYPANYDPEKSYPMITYIYEIRSPSARNYVVPTREHPYNTTVFTQEGYFVFQPDIRYRPRDPGRSAVDAIVPAVQKVVDTTPVDGDRVGLTGHSWGGYQTTFTATQTDLFAAAVAGAPLTNMVSMYNSIYWRSGGTDARIFEISQGRMEVPPWEDMDAYVANSPLHHIESLNTPFLMAFGTDDGAVEFNQGVEFYNAARRAGKQLAFLVYDDENHGISKQDKNSVDYRNRVLEWFDHYLKEETGPSWIEDGIPYLKQIEQKKEEKKASR